MPPSREPLGRLELEVLQYIADHHPISVREVAAHFAETSGQARTTLLTVMERLRAKGYLKRRKAAGASLHADGPQGGAARAAGRRLRGRRAGRIGLTIRCLSEPLAAIERRRGPPPRRIAQADRIARRAKAGEQAMSELIHSIEAWQPILWRASWQGGLVILAAWAIARWCTILSPRVTSWIWRLVCLKLLVTLCWTQPVAIAILPAASRQNAQATIAVENPSLRAVVEAPSPTRERLPLVEPRASTIGEGSDSQGQIATSTILVTLWIAGVCCAVALTVGRWLSARRLCRAAATTESELFQRLCRSEAERLSIRRLPRIRLSPRVESPLLAGIWGPTIVLPARAEESFDESELRLMFGHELAHLKRHDCSGTGCPPWSAGCSSSTRMVWLLKRCWLEAQEAACDELLIQSQIARPAEYGRLLLKLATPRSAEPRVGLAAAGVLAPIAISNGGFSPCHASSHIRAVGSL